MSANPTTTKPWYRHFWPWFILALPATVVIAALATVYIAFRGADSLVDDNYYREGLAINRRLQEDRAATELGLRAEIVFDTLSGEVMVAIPGYRGKEDSLQLWMLHPVDSHRDLLVELRRRSLGNYRGDLEVVLANRFYLRLQSTEGRWRLNGELDFANSSRVHLVPDA